MRFTRRGRDGSRLGLTAAVTVVGTLAIAPGAHAAISVNGPSVTEGTAAGSGGVLSFRVADDSIVCGTTTLYARTADGTAKATGDYVARAGTTDADKLTIPGGLNGIGGACSTTVDVQVSPDALDEADETVTLEVRSSTATSGAAAATGTGTILDDDAPPNLTLTGGSAPEGTGTAGHVPFTVTLSAPSGRVVTVPYTVAPGTATAPEDIDGTPGQIEIAAGATTGEIRVPTVGDDVDEPDEQFSVTLGAPTNATLAAPATNTATGTVLNDDAPVVSIAGVSQAEGTSPTPTPFTFTVSLSKPGRVPVSVRVRTGDVQAKAPGDYEAVDQVVDFAVGETTKTVTVPVVADAVREPDEAFTMALSDPVGATLGTALALGAILNDDAASTGGGGGTGTGTGGGTGIGAGGGTGGGGTTPIGPIDSSQPVVRLASLSYRRSGRTVRVKVSCPASETRCTGTVNVFNIVQSKSKLKVLRRESRLARGSFSLAGGASVTLTMKTTAAGKKVIKAAKSVKVRAYGVAKDPSGNTGISTKTATFKR